MPRGGEKFDKRNVVLELESLKAWVAKRGGGNLIKGMLSGRVAKHGLPRGGKFDKRNVVLELESLKAWVAKGGGKFEKRNVVR